MESREKRLEALLAQAAAALKATHDWILPHPHTEGAIYRGNANVGLYKKIIQELYQYDSDNED